MFDAIPENSSFGEHGEEKTTQLTQSRLLTIFPDEFSTFQDNYFDLFPVWDNLCLMLLQRTVISVNMVKKRQNTIDQYSLMNLQHSRIMIFSYFQFETTFDDIAENSSCSEHGPYNMAISSSRKNCFLGKRQIDACYVLVVKQHRALGTDAWNQLTKSNR